jgi:hypothetical protein
MKTKLFVFLSLIFSSTFLFGQDLSDGLILYYNFNGNCDDSSGNEMNGIVNGPSLTNDKFGNANSAYFFDGVDDYIQLPNENVLKPQLPVTLSALIYVEDVTSPYSILRTEFTPNSFYGCWLNLTDHLSVEVGYGAGIDNSTTFNDKRIFITDDAIKLKNWYFIVSVIRSIDDMEVWINGEKQSGEYKGYATNTELIYSTSSPNSGAIGVDDYTDLAPYYFNGIMDEIRIWNRSISEPEILSLISSVLSFDDTSKKQLISIYPNPSNGDITLFLGSKKSVNVEVYDVTGKCILTFSDYVGSDLKINNLNQGLYFVKIQSETIQSTQRIVVTNN